VTPGFIDTHLHLEELGDPAEVVAAAASAGVTRLVAVGVDLDTSRRAVETARRHPAVWAGVGHHPTETTGPDIDALRALARDDGVVVIGEVGLDFNQGKAPRNEQWGWFEKMCSLAADLDLPVSVHNRDAADEVASVIQEHPGLRGVMHYFALGWAEAERFLDLGFYLSFAGLVTRPSRHELREVVRRCPADRLLLETDSPYGNAQKRMGQANRPAFLIDTAEVVAELRGVSLDELAALECANALALFTRMR
jgi:TatD DNase family protein